MSKFDIGDFVLCKGTSGYWDYEYRHGLVIARKRFLWRERYLVVYKVHWTDLGYTEEFRRWRMGFRLVKDTVRG